MALPIGKPTRAANLVQLSMGMLHHTRILWRHRSPVNQVRQDRRSVADSKTPTTIKPVEWGFATDLCHGMQVSAVILGGELDVTGQMLY